MEGKKHRKGIIEWVVVAVLVVILAGTCYYTKGKMDDVKNVEAPLPSAKIVLYEGPKSLKDAAAEDIALATEYRRDFSLMHCTDTTVKVDGYDCYVYDTNVNLNRSWFPDYQPPQSRTPVTYFDFQGEVTLEVSVPDIELNEVKISPVEDGIVPEIDKANHTVRFKITEPKAYTLTFNQSPERAVHIFANPLEVNPPKEGDENVIYIGPGEWKIDAIMLEDNQTLYLAGGAVVHSIIQANHAKNIKVMGRGIIDGSTYRGWHATTAMVPLKFDNCDNVEIHDIIALNPNAWVCNAEGSKNGLIDGLKIISSRPNGDGITLQSVENYTIQNCFVRSWDDSLVVKNYSKDSDAHNITFRNNQVWTDLAQSCEIGFETNKGMKTDAKIYDVKFENITILNNYHKPAISIHNADDATVSDISYKNIVIENEEIGSGDSDSSYLLDFWIMQNGNWSKTPDRGQIRNVTVDGLKVLSGTDKGLKMRIKGYDAQHTVENVSIKNLEILGNKITGFDYNKLNIIDENSTKNITIE